MANLTDAQLRVWLRTHNRTHKPLAGKADGDGLTFCISSAGKATWVLRYRVGGKAKAMTLGTYPGMSLAMARDDARKHRVEISRGNDPLSVRQAQEAALRGQKTFNDLADAYLAKVGPTLAENTSTDYVRFLRKDVRPAIGRKALAEIRGADMVALLEKVAARTYSTADRIYTMLSMIFKFGVARAMLDENPMLGLSPRAILGKAPPVRKRVALTDDELRAMLAALPAVGRQNALAVRILLATCVRRSELIQARVEHVDLDAGRWTIPDENAKSGRGIVVPLAPTVVELFREMIGIAQLIGSPWVYPSTTPRNHSTPTRLNRALGRLDADVRKFSPHDLRSTARSHLGKLGVDIVVAERCLNHSLGALVAIYDVGDYWDERKRALELWARHLENLEKPKADNVVPFAPRAA